MIEITSLPDYGVDGFLDGVVTGADPATHHVATYIQIEGSGWWSKPTTSAPTSPINPDGTFNVDVATGGIDNRATIYCTALLPTGLNPPLATGASRIPAALNPDALDCNERYGRTIEFAGRTWAVKESPLPVGPGGNRFSDHADDVFVDAQGRLHLGVRFRDGFWRSSEVILLDRLGHGTYSLQTADGSGLAELDPNIVFGTFTWDPYGDDDAQPAWPHREIDFEDSRWGNAADPMNAQMVVQPYHVPGNLRRYTIPDGALTRWFDWGPDQIEFAALEGLHAPGTLPAGSVIDHFTYENDPGVSHIVPTPGRAAVHLNLWLNGAQPLDGQPAEVIISDFTFIPEPATSHMLLALPLVIRRRRARKNGA